ncbi:MAG: YdeI/OmpD-associated family protein [Saprospiraceae bacterium]|nr:YdeI/OmpD-associated family protein [Saprospiraceae bacterium]
MNPEIDNYLAEGCGRCPLGGTPECKVHKWTAQLEQLRRIVLDCGLTEERKWGVPCYTFQGKNILIVSAFKDFCSVNFFKGVLLADEQNLLVSPGPNSQSARYFPFTETKTILELEDTIRSYVFEAIEVEKAGLQVSFKAKENLEYPEELSAKLEEDPVFKEAFEALTPGRQRSYVLHIAAAKQPATRVSRVEKSISKVMEGKGWNEY